MNDDSARKFSAHPVGLGMAAEHSEEDRHRALAAFIESMLDRHGVPERQRIRALEAAIGISYTQVRRRMIGEAPWTIDEIKKLASHFHEPLIPIMSALADAPGIPATLPFGGAAMPCTIWPVGEPLPGRIGPMVAMHDSTTDQWTVAPAAEVSDSPSYELARLLFERAPPRRVAVLDDDRDSAQSIVDFLGAKGLDAQPFNCAIDLLAAMESQPFDGFVVDWLLGDNTAKDLLSKIRARVPSGPVVILTGQIATGAASEDELVMVGASYRALLFEKPTRPLSIFNALQVGFTSPTTPG
jgi:ActR/RegA family two-component response regulator